jgi:hypothetical protein
MIKGCKHWIQFRVFGRTIFFLNDSKDAHDVARGMWETTKDNDDDEEDVESDRLILLE